jgi:alginate O-acetyltransferase complex protein AlgI
LHGSYLVVAHQWRRFITSRAWRLDYWWYRFPSTALTFLVVLFAWVFFRAATLGVAWDVLSSMVGQHGLTMTDAVTDPAKFPGLWCAKLGVRFVPQTFAIESYGVVMALMLLMLIIVFLLPNAQQMLAAYSPALEPVEHAGLFRLKLGLGSAVFFGGAFFFVLRSFYIAAPSPFLYFNF